MQYPKSTASTDQQYHTMLLYYILSILFLRCKIPCSAARPAPALTTTPATEAVAVKDSNYTWQNFGSFLNASKGSHVNGMSELKRYFHHFGYLPSQDLKNITDILDAGLETAIVRYQAKLGLQITGELDLDTLNQIMAPRCGVPDDTMFHKLHASRHYMYFPGKPRWSRSIPMTLTYSFSKEYVINSLSLLDIKQVFKRAFEKWGSVIPVSFVETDDYVFSDMKIGFYSGDHGDGEPFDGVLGVLAHSFSPESGRFHLDARETWAIDFDVEKSNVAVDLESVAVHEIGHLLGLGHSSDEKAVMYPSLKPREKKLDLSVDDIQGVQALYGSNPNFTLGSSLESDISTNQAVDLIRIRLSLWWVALIMALMLSFA
ncbi:hypothetical protein SADUNF_Sadunf14G0037500 [Salix dunnii]|uniref:Peptidase metallopeptidase domain-containing protein n=1 Tax=Salix dunnii TaxID=1413687 RepID=A0A835MK60_9ROSI|nr:hypothetical protein SADUNF_Sadunf14G0037500 [Salix dunnii]